MVHQKIDKLLIIGHQWPQPNATAAGEHMMHLIEYFLLLNHEILFVSAAQIPNNYAVLENKHIKSQRILLNDDSFDLLLKEYEPTTVLFDRFMTEEQFSWRIQLQCPNTIKVLDTEDLHFLRNERLQELKGKSTVGLSEITKRELASIYRCDLSLIISKAEKRLLQKTYQIPKAILHYIPLVSKPSNKLVLPLYSERSDLIFAGNFLHEPNWNCVQYLKKEIWPILSKQLPKATLHIYGSHASQKHLQLSNKKERFIVHGYVEDINSKLLKAKILLAPIQFGAGQKGKLLRAMQCGLPNITTSIGAEGMFFKNQWAGKIADTPQEFIQQTIALYTNETKWFDAQNKAASIIKKHHDFYCYFKKFQNKLKKLQTNLPKHRLQNHTGQILWHHSLRSIEFMSRWIMEKNKV